MSLFKTIITNLPEVAGPTQKKLSFKEKLKWTLIILVLFFIMGVIPLFGLDPNSALKQFEYLSMILGAQFGSLMSLGIGPIVTASIVLQLLNGSGIIKFDLKTQEGKRNFQGVQKLLALFFIIFEAAIYVLMGGLVPAAQFQGTSLWFELELLLIFQLILGGIIVMFMDEVVSKWGFGSGISLFIAAGVSQSLFVRALSPLHLVEGGVKQEAFIGAIPELIRSIMVRDPLTAALMLFPIIFTILVFVIAVFVQAMKVEIPLSFGRIRGHGIRWPLSFIYTSNIPVILVAALLANIQLWAGLLAKWGHPILGTFQGNVPASGFVTWVNPPNLVQAIITGTLQIFPTGNGFWYALQNSDVAHALSYLLLMMVGAVVFSYFWVQTSGMDAKSQANQIMSSGLQIPGFRKDPRVMERLLERYIGPLTIMGALTIGFLAALADLTGALTSGTGLLLTVMIIYKLYEEIAKQHMMDMNPMMRKFMS